MFDFPPMYPELSDRYECICRCRKQRCREPDWIDRLCPANVSATVLGMDECGGIIIRIQRCMPDCPCRKPCRR